MITVDEIDLPVPLRNAIQRIARPTQPRKSVSEALPCFRFQQFVLLRVQQFVLNDPKVCLAHYSLIMRLHCLSGAIVMVGDVSVYDCFVVLHAGMSQSVVERNIISWKESRYKKSRDQESQDQKSRSEVKIRRQDQKSRSEVKIR